MRGAPARRYKYICLDCGEATWFDCRERTRAAGIQCKYCGSRRLEPSKKSLARQNIPVFHDLKRAYDERVAVSEGKVKR